MVSAESMCLIHVHLFCAGPAAPPAAGSGAAALAKDILVGRHCRSTARLAVLDHHVQVAVRRHLRAVKGRDVRVARGAVERRRRYQRPNRRLALRGGPGSNWTRDWLAKIYMRPYGILPNQSNTQWAQCAGKWPRLAASRSAPQMPGQGRGVANRRQAGSALNGAPDPLALPIVRRCACCW